MAVKRLHCIFSGNVQGVGFRYSAERAATSLGLAGWVRNTDDGKVEAMCEGPEDDIRAFLGKMESIFGPFIGSRDEEWGEPTGEYEGFDIRF